MQLESIVTLANRGVELRFLALERSLRATGCELPLKVIPYDENLFELPANATWWEVPELIAWTRHWKTHPMMRKYQALTIPAVQFVDADVIFLRNPKQVLAACEGFITSCGHWHNPAETLTAESNTYYAERSTTWQKQIFNAGQWACNEALYTPRSLMERAETPHFASTCVSYPYHDQPGLNLLVNSSGVEIHNLTLPPFNMQSTWAGDYDGDYRHFWRTEKETPYLIHWAGVAMDTPRPINELFLDFLTMAEKKEWSEQVVNSVRRREAARRKFRSRARVCRNAIRAFFHTLGS